MYALLSPFVVLPLAYAWIAFLIDRRLDPAALNSKRIQLVAFVVTMTAAIINFWRTLLFIMNNPDYTHMGSVALALILTIVMGWFGSRYVFFGQGEHTKRGNIVHFIVFAMASIGLLLFGWFVC